MPFAGGGSILSIKRVKRKKADLSCCGTCAALLFLLLTNVRVRQSHFC